MNDTSTTPSEFLSQTFFVPSLSATDKQGVLAELAAKPTKVEYFNVFGEKTDEANVTAGLVRLAVPASGYAKIAWR